MQPLRYTTYREWYTGGRLAPFIDEIRGIGGHDLDMLRVRQPAGDVSDPPVDQYVLAMPIRRSVSLSRLDCGGGRFSGLVSPGSFVLVPPSTPTACIAETPHDAIFLAISRDRVERLTDCRDFGRFHLRPSRDSFVEHALMRLWSEAARGDRVAALFADSVVAAIIAALSRDPHVGAVKEPSALAPRTAALVMDYMADHLSADVRLADLASLAHLSQFHFCRAFKRSTGLAPMQFLQMLRIERAKELLAGTTPIPDVAAAVGYDSASHFARIFKRATASTPAEWRREFRG